MPICPTAIFRLKANSFPINLLFLSLSAKQEAAPLSVRHHNCHLLHEASAQIYTGINNAIALLKSRLLPEMETDLGQCGISLCENLLL